jgi:hypothetical protein
MHIVALAASAEYSACCPPCAHPLGRTACAASWVGDTVPRPLTLHLALLLAHTEFSLLMSDLPKPRLIRRSFSRSPSPKHKRLMYPSAAALSVRTRRGHSCSIQIPKTLQSSTMSAIPSMNQTQVKPIKTIQTMKPLDELSVADILASMT